MTGLLVGVLVVWRLTSLLSREPGPYFIFDRFRHMVGVRYDHMENAYGVGLLGEIFACFWCLSLWVAYLVGLCYSDGTLFSYTLAPLALSGGAILLDLWLYQKKSEHT